jgi:ribose/xylose/arabinose/galactoside ABC-type transport system permease subunit
MAFQLPEFGILAIAMMVVIVSGGINLSITYTATLSSIVGAVAIVAMNQAGAADWEAILAGVVIALAIGLACGAINGFVVAYVGVTPMLVTLGTMTLFEGVSLNITKGGAISGFPDAFLWFGNEAVLGVPVPMILFLLVVLASWYLLGRSRFGFSVYMIGCNPRATMFSGINVKKVLFSVYLFSALLCAISGLIMSSRYNSAKESYGSSYLLQSLAAAVLGGTDIAGGHGSLSGTILAVMILQVISSGTNIIGVNRYLTNIIMGAILIFVLALNFLSSRREIRKI